jgi:hypothetical protein
MKKKSAQNCVHQNNDHKNVLDILDESDIHLVADLAMKCLPAGCRQRQQQFLGTRGLSWYITYAIRIKPSETSTSSSCPNPCADVDTRVFEHRSFCRMFDNVKQDDHAV